MPRVKGKGPILSAHFVGKGGAKKNFPNLKATKDLMLLSIVGNEYCEGEYLEASLQYAVKQHEFTTLLIADEVYWHNLKTTTGPLSPEAEGILKTKAIKLGEEYFERNLKHFFAPLKLPVEQFNAHYANVSTDEKIQLINRLAKDAGLNYEIVGWQDWINNQAHNFSKKQAEIMALYQSNEILRASIESTAKEFAERHQQEGGLPLCYHRSVGYLTEESPAVMWIAAALGYNFVVYPGDMLDTFQATKDYFIVSTATDEAQKPPFAISAENPHLLVNWMQSYFKRGKPKENEKETPLRANSLTFFAPKPDKSKSDLGAAISEAMLKNLSFTNKVANLDLVKDLTSMLFSLNARQRKELINLITNISTVVDIVQDYQMEPEEHDEEGLGMRTSLV